MTKQVSNCVHAAIYARVSSDATRPTSEALSDCMFTHQIVLLVSTHIKY